MPKVVSFSAFSRSHRTNTAPLSRKRKPLGIIKDWAGVIFGLSGLMMSIFNLLEMQRSKTMSLQMQIDQSLDEAIDALSGGQVSGVLRESLDTDARGMVTAWRAIRKAITIDPNNAMTYVRLAQYQSRLGADDDAIESCRKALKIKPDLLSAYIELGLLLEEKGRLDEAENVLRQAIGRQPPKPDPMITALLYNNLGKILYARGSLGEARKTYELAVKTVNLGPVAALAYYGLGVVSLAEGKPTAKRDAESYFRKSSYSDPLLLEPLEGLKSILREEYRFEEIAHLEERIGAVKNLLKQGDQSS